LGNSYMWVEPGGRHARKDIAALSSLAATARTMRLLGSSANDR